MSESTENNFVSQPNKPARSLSKDVVVSKTLPKSSRLAQSILLKQSSVWSRAILWSVISVTSLVATWACVAEIETVIPAKGKLEPMSTVKEIQSPVGGVVTTVNVADGQRVKQGDLLIVLDSTDARSQLDSLQKIRKALAQENLFYRAQMGRGAAEADIQTIAAQLRLSPEYAALTQSRSTLVAENQFYRAQLSDGGTGSNLSTEAKIRLQSSQAELSSRILSEKLATEQLKRQLSQTQVQVATAKDILMTNQTILDGIEPLYQEGGIARVQYLKQQQDVRSRQSEVERLLQEQTRLQLAIAQSQQQVQMTLASAQNEVFNKIAENEKTIAAFDAQLNKAIVENEKRIIELDSQISRAGLNIRYQELRSPVNGTVFSLQARSPGFVANPSQAILKVVPDDALVAEVFISNKDIGFVNETMKVDVRIDAFPFSEFGDVKGEVTWVGSDALPPEQNRPFYSFPAKIRLDQQTLIIRDRKVHLQSGMSVSVNIRLRKRTVASIFTDLFAQKIDLLRSVR